MKLNQEIFYLSTLLMNDRHNGFTEYTANGFNKKKKINKNF